MATIADPISGDIAAVKPASTAPVATDKAFVVAISPNTPAVPTAGNKTNNSAAPGATNIGALTGLAEASPTALTAGNLVLHSVDLASAVRVVNRPIAHGALGQYRTSHRCALVATQAANSRIFEFRNTTTNPIVLMRLTIKWLQTAAHTAAIEDSLDVFRCTTFTAVDTTNTVTPSGSIKRTTGMAAFPGGALIRGVTVAGVAAGMTGGTLTKDGAPWSQLPQWLLLAQPTAGTVQPIVLDALDDEFGVHPFVFGQNEGFEIENRVLLGAAAGSSVYIDCSWAEAAGF